MAMGDGADPEPQDGAPVRLGMSTGDAVSLFVVAPIIGMGFGITLPWVARWVDGRPWVPFQGPIELLASIDIRWGMAIGLVAGLALGGALAVVTVRDATRVIIARDSVSFEKGGGTQRVERSDIQAVFLDGEVLVITDSATRERVREQVDAKPHRIEQAFRRHDYPWYRDDPNGDAFQRWVSGSPDLPQSVNAILMARERALREKDSTDADDLRADLVKKGFVVKDSGTRQFWRPLL